MPQVLAEVPDRALIWLDGHYCGPGTGRGVKWTPVVEELIHVWNDPHRHVIFIDDARIFAEGPEHDLEEHYSDYPALSWVRAEAGKRNYQYILADDIIRLIPKELLDA